jgi:hypothetical protein
MESPDAMLPTVLKVVDALDHPHGNRILRTRLVDGTPPTIGALKGARLRALGPGGVEFEIRVVGFPVFGGALSDARIRSTGRIDLLVSGDDDLTEVSRTWELRPVSS